MNTQILTSARRALKNGSALALMGFTSVILTACGGGSSTDSAFTVAVSSEEGRAQALSVPPGWTGRAPRYEVINGITVPPEPAPSVNNSTLAGVDINNNGVRDDVEREIARKYAPNHALMMSGARVYGKFIAGGSVTSSEYKASFCALATAKIDTSGILVLLTNTNQRLEAFYKNIDLTVPECAQ